MREAARNKDFYDFDKNPEHTVPEPCAHTLEVVKAAARHETALTHEELERLAQNIVGALKTVYDPEIPADIYEIGLIYKIDIDDDRNVEVDMTLTAPGCGMGDILVGDAQEKIAVIPTVAEVRVDLVFDPPWNQTMMSEEARLQTGMMY